MRRQAQCWRQAAPHSPPVQSPRNQRRWLWNRGHVKIAQIDHRVELKGKLDGFSPTGGSISRCPC